MRLVDIMFAVPSLLVALVAAVALGPSMRNLVLILGLLIWPNIARLIRGETLVLKNNEFVGYAKAIGVAALAHPMEATSCLTSCRHCWSPRRWRSPT